MTTGYVANPGKRKSTDETLEPETRTYKTKRILGQGSFGVVYQSQVLETNEIVAIKSMRLQGNDREVQVLRELNGHPNIVCIKGAFFSRDRDGTEMSLNVVLEYLSDTLHRVIKHFNRLKTRMGQDHVKSNMFQLLRALAFMHGKGIIHCDVKPQNILVDGNSQTIKLCDFGTARRLKFGEQSLCYVCSRYFRAPELILGSTSYSTPVDLWSAGCVFGEMILGQPLFTGADGIQQLVEIMKVIGTPTPAELTAMNPNYPVYQFTPAVLPHPWETVFRGWSTPEAYDFVGQLLRYDPSLRVTALTSLVHSYFADLANFEFLHDELSWLPEEKRRQLLQRHRVAQPAPVVPSFADIARPPVPSAGVRNEEKERRFLSAVVSNLKQMDPPAQQTHMETIKMKLIKKPAALTAAGFTLRSLDEQFAKLFVRYGTSGAAIKDVKTTDDAAAPLAPKSSPATPPSIVPKAEMPVKVPKVSAHVPSRYAATRRIYEDNKTEPTPEEVVEKAERKRLKKALRRKREREALQEGAETDAATDSEPNSEDASSLGSGSE